MQLFQFDNAATGDTIALSALDKDGQAWFVAADVCKALEIKNSRQSLSTLEPDEKGVCTTDTLGGRQQVAIINESGLYSLIFRSRKESAKRFKKWVTAVVIPSIRQNGGYINGQEALSKPEQAATLQVIKQEAKRVGLCAVEEREARSATFKLMSRSPSYDKHGKRIR
ncbi:MAG: N-terminal [Proteobacteria bacterium]|nr:N-terminal [Pseudomonadota bacterium]